MKNCSSPAAASISRTSGFSLGSAFIRTKLAAAQEILISASVWVDKKPLGEDIENTVSYATLAEIARRIVRSHHFLVETVVEEMIREIRVLPGVRAGRVDCRKTHAVTGADASRC